MVDSLAVGRLLEWTQSYDYSSEYIRSLLLEKHPKELIDRIMPYDGSGWSPSYESVTVSDEELKKMGLFEQFKPPN